MRNVSPSLFLRICRSGLVLSVCGFGVAGCGVGGPGIGTSAEPAARVTFNGRVMGGQQPVSGATIALYAAGKGAGVAPRSMLTSAVLSGLDGSFTITGKYSCQAGDQVYLVGTGGNAGSGVNPAIAMMTALGPCAPLVTNAATTFIAVNEVTTVASVYALAKYMTGVQGVSSATDTASTNALAAAFANVKTMVDTTTGFAPTTSTGNGVVPQTTLNSLANALAGCINSVPGSSNSCSNLFSATTVTGSTPTETVQAALNLAHFPATNPAQVFAVIGPNPPFVPTLASAPATYALTVTHPSDVLTYHNDNARTGAQTAETVLTPANVNATNFGKKYSFAVDSYLFAQPLYVGGVGMPDGAVHNVLLAASTKATVYAFDADGNNPAAGYLWSVSLLPSGELAPVGADYGCNNPPEAGIVGTPVVDREAGTIYVITKTKNAAGTAFFQRMHALSLVDGSERAGSPVLIQPSFAGTGTGSSGGVVPFNPQRQMNRAALLLAPNASGGKTVWAAFASHCDIGPYHGLVLGFDGTSMAMTAAFNNTPNGGEGGIWLGAGGLAADASGYIYALGGNGSFDANTGGVNYGDSAVKLSPPASTATTAMTVADYFTPSNQAALNSADLDLGGTEAILFTDTASGVAPNLMIASDKNSTVYVINTASMGGYRLGTHGVDSLNKDVQDFSSEQGSILNFAYFNNVLYTSTPLRAYSFTPGTSTTAGQFNPTAVGGAGNIQAPPVISANGTANTVIWAEEAGSVMHAYTSPGFGEIYRTQMAAGGRDTPPGYVKFTSPIVANGKVFLSGNGSIAVYGLLP